MCHNITSITKDNDIVWQKLYNKARNLTETEFHGAYKYRLRFLLNVSLPYVSVGRQSTMPQKEEKFYMYRNIVLTALAGGGRLQVF